MNGICNFDWSAAAAKPEYTALIEELTQIYESECKTPIPQLTYEMFMEFSKTGIRSGYENAYFARRRRLGALGALSLLYPDNKEYFAAMQALLWEICAECTWCVPAHVYYAKNAEERVTTIDLFSAETGFELSEILSLFGGRLDAILADRLRYEIKRRVTDPFIAKKSVWEDYRTNWAAICGGYVGGCFLYSDPERFELAEPRIERAMQMFLSGMSGDGACLEGVSYWGAGFGVFCLYYALKEELRPGGRDIFAEEKVERISQFFQYACFKNAMALTFSDAQPKAVYCLHILHFLKRKYGDKIKVPPFCFHMPMRRCRLNGILRAFLYYSPEDNEPRIADFLHYFPEAQMLVLSQSRYEFAVKAGHNDEPHNHNDVGSFLFAVDGVQYLCDIGVGVYTKDYFGKDTRYKLIGNGSQGHCVPIIDGKYQSVGGEYRAKNVSFDGECFTADIGGAYEGAYSAVRKITLLENGIRLCDSFSGVKESLTERFVSYLEPELLEDRVRIGRAEIRYSSESMKCVYSCEQYENNFMGRVPIYLIDFIALHNPNETYTFDIIAAE